MTVLENKLTKNNIVDIRNINVPLKVYRCEYVMYPKDGDYDRRTAYLAAENAEIAEQMIVKSIERGVRFDWESRPGLVADIHGISESLQRTLFLKLKEKYEGPSKITKAKKIMR